MLTMATDDTTEADLWEGDRNKTLKLLSLTMKKNELLSLRVHFEVPPGSAPLCHILIISRNTII